MYYDHYPTDGWRLRGARKHTCQILELEKSMKNMYRQNKLYLGLLRSLSNSPVNLTKLSKFYEFYEFHWKLTCNLLAKEPWEDQSGYGKEKTKKTKKSKRSKMSTRLDWTRRTYQKTTKDVSRSNPLVVAQPKMFHEATLWSPDVKEDLLEIRTNPF